MTEFCKAVGAVRFCYSSGVRSLLFCLLLWVACSTQADSGLHPGEQILALSEGNLRVLLHRAEIGDRSLYLVRAELPRDSSFRVKAAAKPTRLGHIVGDGSLVALNGGFYDTEGEPLGLVVEDGRVIEAKLAKGGSAGEASPRWAPDGAPPSPCSSGVLCVACGLCGRGCCCGSAASGVAATAARPVCLRPHTGGRADPAARESPAHSPAHW